MVEGLCKDKKSRSKGEGIGRGRSFRKSWGERVLREGRGRVEGE